MVHTGRAEGLEGQLWGGGGETGRAAISPRVREAGGFPGGSDSKESACNAGDLGLLPGSGRCPEGGHGSPFWYPCLENSMDRSLVGNSPQGHKASDTTEQLTLSLLWEAVVVGRVPK